MRAAFDSSGLRGGRQKGSQARSSDVAFSGRLDLTPVLDCQSMLAFHRARRRLGELLCDPDFELRLRLDAGDLMMFDNIRVLHGRTGYDPNEGHRQLQGCYIDRDGPRSLYRVLRRRFAIPATPTEEAA